MKKNLIIQLLVLFIFAISCEKQVENEILDNKDKMKNQISEVSMLVIEDVGQLSEMREEMMSLNLSERKDWEQSQGFKSIGTLADEFYLSIDFSEFESQDELLKFINENDHYLELIEEPDGEKVLETILSDNWFRYFANEDGLFRVADHYYKVLQKSTVKAKIEYLEKLKKFTKQDLHSIDDLQEISLAHKTSESINLKDNQHVCGSDNSVDEPVTNGRNRTKIKIKIEKDFSTPPFLKIFTTYLVRPYYKTLGIWYHCTRTISCDFKVATGWYDVYNHVWEREIGEYSNSGELASSLSGDLSSFVVTSTSTPVHFDGYYCWGDTPSTDPPVVISCNPHLVSAK